MEHLNQMIGTISDKLFAAGESDAAVGDPIQIGDYKIIVITRTSVGFGGGGGEGEGMGPHHHHKKKGGPPPMMQGKGTGGGGGGGVKVRPVGVIAFGPDGVKVLPVPDKPGLVDKLFEKVPDLVEKIQALIPDSSN